MRSLKDTVLYINITLYLSLNSFCWLLLDVVGGGGGVRVLALMDTVPSVKLESFGQWGVRVNTAKYTNLCFTCTHLEVLQILLITGICSVHSAIFFLQGMQNNRILGNLMLAI